MKKADQITALCVVTDRDRLAFVLEQNGYRVEQDSTEMWKITRIKGQSK